LGLSQAEVAEKMSMKQAGYAAWERDPVALRQEQIRRLAEISTFLLNISWASRNNPPTRAVRPGNPPGFREGKPLASSPAEQGGGIR
jgi:transcriptional regulator with XRE-family HTH domain